ncbi:MAG: ASCH domain-containing protein [Acholeplasmatales bacterium]|nr:ASCH domain-containing protein [Acholeplasmatales bacterium]
MTDIEMFDIFKKNNNIESDFATYDYDMESLKAILEGKKTHEVSLYDDYVANKEPLPIKGDYAVVCDEAGEAKAIIKTTAVNIIEYAQVKDKGDLEAYAKENGIKLMKETLCVEEVFEIAYK